MSRRDRMIGIAAGIVLGIAVVAVFVFTGSEDRIDAPAIEGGAAGEAGGGQATGGGEGREKSGGIGRGDGAKEPPVQDTQKPPAQDTRKPPVQDIFVRGGEPQGGVATFEFEGGEEVRFRVISDTAGEVHVHGYDIYKDVQPGQPAGVSFPAEFEGAFEVELHMHDTGANVQIAELQVTPG